MRESLISVIVPVYNVERYLQQSIDSVLWQTYRNWELILVDDGSTDGSEAICKRAAELDARVRTLRQSNGGAATARNRGLTDAQGDWVLFFDSDDFYIRDDAMERLLNCAAESGAQIVCFDFCRMEGNQAPAVTDRPTKASLSTVREMVQSNRYTSSAALKLIHRDVFKQLSLRFESGMFCEDVEWSLRLLLASVRMVFLPETFYCYRIRSGSVTQSISKKHVMDLLYAVEKCQEDCLACEDEALRELGLTYTAFQYCTLLINLRLSKERVERAVVRKIVALKHLLRNNAIPAVRLVSLASRVVGVRAASWLLVVYFLFFHDGGSSLKNHLKRFLHEN